MESQDDQPVEKQPPQPDIGSVPAWGATPQHEVLSRVDDNEKPSPKDEEMLRLSEIVSTFELFHSDGHAEQAYAKMNLRGKAEVVRIDSRKFRRGLTYLYKKEHGSYPSFSSVKTIVEGSAALAQFKCRSQLVNVRVGEHEGAIFIDLCNDAGQFIKVVPGHWEIVTESPLRFIRQPGMLPLPTPLLEGKIEDLWQCLKLESNGNHEQCLIGAWLIQALVPKGPFPILWVAGAQGAGKTTLCRMVRRLIDPNVAPVRAISQTERELLIAATNSWVLGLDNISGLKDAMSDAMCRLATGAGFAARRLFTDADEHLIYVRRPQMVNGIDDLALNSDLMDRGLFITLQPIPATERKTESDLWAEFEDKSASIFGALLDVLCKSLESLPHTTPANLPRMADFAKLGIAAETHMGFKVGTFEQAYKRNKQSSDRLAVESTPVGLAIVRLIKKEKSHFEGTAEKLLKDLGALAQSEWLKSSDWPRIPRQLSVQLRRIAPNLEGIGVRVEFPRRTAKERKLTLKRIAENK